MKGNGAEILVAYLEKEGVRQVFGIPGGHVLTLYDALYRSSVTPILTKHEGGAAYMAAGYALVSGRLGVCAATVGPGATNLVSGVAAAKMNSLPMLVLTAQVGTPTIGRGGLQEAAGETHAFQHTALLGAVSKHSTMVTHSSKVAQATRQALRTAYAGRPGPVHLDLPADVQRGPAEDEILEPARYRPTPRYLPPTEDLRRAAGLLVGAKKPGILVGAGGRKGNAPLHLLRLAELLACPVATTLPGKGAIPEDHPLALGCLGLYGTRAANSYMRSGLDVLLVVGASLHEFTTHVWDPALQPTAALIQIEIDPTETGRNYPVDLALFGDGAMTTEALADEVRARLPRDVPATDHLASFKTEQEYFSEKAMSATHVPLKPQRVMVELRRALPEDGLVFTDIGNNLTWVERNFLARRPDTTMSLSGLAAMGSGVAAAVGGKLAAGERPVVAVCGDGDFQMQGMEVMTAVNHDIPVVWLILQNDQLAMIRDLQTIAYQGRYVASAIRNPDFVKLAEAFGVPGLRAERPGEVAEAVTAALATGRPAIVTVPIDPEEHPPAKARMMAMDRSLGTPPTRKSLSWGGLRAIREMLRER
jgi:acetolactate synthase I/II/III large subunit